MTKADAAKLVAVLSAAYPRQEVDEATLAVYCRSLIDLDYATAERGAQRLINSSRWFPTVAEIREAALPLPSASEAWELVHESWRRASARSEPGAFARDLPQIAARALDVAGGADAFRFGDPRALRTQFFRAYDELRRSTVAAGAAELRAALEPPPAPPLALGAGTDG